MISVVIPLYNKASCIAKTILSVQRQSYDNWEIIIVDDGSTDASLIIVESIGDSRIHILEQENRGPSSARNVGVQASRGEWIVFLDADDELLPNALAQFACVIASAKDANFIVAPFYVNDGINQRMSREYIEGWVDNPFKEHYYGRLLPRTGAFAIRRDLMVRNLFDERIRRFEDLEMLFRLYRMARIWATEKPTMVVNTAFAQASKGRKDIDEDFVGHLDFRGKSFWERMCLYQVFLGERPHYPEQCKKMYPWLYWRLDYLLLTKFLK